LLLSFVCLYVAFLDLFFHVSVLRIAFFPNLMERLLCQFTVKLNLGLLLCKFAYFGLVLSDFSAIFAFNLLACFFFV